MYYHQYHSLNQHVIILIGSEQHLNDDNDTNQQTNTIFGAKYYPKAYHVEFCPDDFKTQCWWAKQNIPGISKYHPVVILYYKIIMMIPHKLI